VENCKGIDARVGRYILERHWLHGRGQVLGSAGGQETNERMCLVVQVEWHDL